MRELNKEENHGSCTWIGLNTERKRKINWKERKIGCLGFYQKPCSICYQIKNPSLHSAPSLNSVERNTAGLQYFLLVYVLQDMNHQGIIASCLRFTRQVT